MDNLIEYTPNSMRTPELYKELNDIWEPRKEYIDKDLWVIRNFLSQEEIDWILWEASKPKDWYITMRSIYRNVANKYLEAIPEYDSNGNMILPTGSDAKRISIPHFKDTYGIENRIWSVIKPFFIGTSTLQSFFAVTDEEVESFSDEEKKRYALAKKENFSFPYHCEEDAQHPQTGAKMTAAFSIYLNDDFEGGELMFKYKPDIVIKPEPGMLVNVPLTKEFTHKVAFVKGKHRHTIYGNCWDNPEIAPISTNDDC